MPEKIPFSVVFCSGADDGHPATDLEVCFVCVHHAHVWRFLLCEFSCSLFSVGNTSTMLLMGNTPGQSVMYGNIDSV